MEMIASTWAYCMCTYGVVSERFHSESFQKAPNLFTQFNENQHKSHLRTKNKLHVIKIFIVHIVFILTCENAWKQPCVDIVLVAPRRY